jgi:hypothetical protein
MGRFFNEKLMQAKDIKPSTKGFKSDLEQERRKFNEQNLDSPSDNGTETGVVASDRGNESQAKPVVFLAENGRPATRPASKKRTRKARNNKGKRSQLGSRTGGKTVRIPSEGGGSPEGNQTINVNQG